jgi:simple sugar transport system permease protein
LSSWWTKIIVGILLFSFIALQRLLIIMSERRKVVNTSRIGSLATGDS